VHPSACEDFPATVAAMGARAGAAIGLDEPAEAVLDVLDALSIVLVMGTPIGVKGYDFDRGALDTVAAAHRARAATGTEVYVDGGIRWSSVGDIASAGADGVVAGSIVTSAADPAAAIAAVTRLGIEPRTADAPDRVLK
jgi:ribulose-phosphate 3-epimerase